MSAAHRRHDISDKVWEKLGLAWQGRAEAGGGIAQDNRFVIKAIFWIMRTGAPCRRTMVAIPIADLYGGVIKVYGKSCLKY